MKRTLIPPFRSGPWTAPVPADQAKEVDGVPIAERLATRSDAPGVLVRLENGRHAILGDIVAVGHPLLLRRFVQRRALRAASAAERDWWDVVRRELSLLLPSAVPAAARERALA